MHFNAEKMFRMCMRKRKFFSQTVARNVAKECDKKYGKTHRVYFCPLCGYYHLTTKESYDKTVEKFNESK